MNFRQLWYLQLIIAKGSFAGAAKEAGVSQPAITQAMQAMEKAWGVPMFKKVGREKRPTDAAIAMAQQASELQGRLEKLAAPASVGSLPLGRTLRVGMAPAAALLYGAAIEGIWRTFEPEGLLQILSGSTPELLGALQQGGLDLVAAPRPRRYQQEGLEQLPLHLSQPIVYARKGHPMLSATSLQEIHAASWAVSGRGGTAGNVIEEACRVRRLPPPRILVQCSDYMTVLDLVAKSDMLCVVPHPVLIAQRQQESVRALNIREGLPQYEVCLFWKAQSPPLNAEAISAVVAGLQPFAQHNSTDSPARKRTPARRLS